MYWAGVDPRFSPAQILAVLRPDSCHGRSGLRSLLHWLFAGVWRGLIAGCEPGARALVCSGAAQAACPTVSRPWFGMGNFSLGSVGSDDLSPSDAAGSHRMACVASGVSMASGVLESSFGCGLAELGLPLPSIEPVSGLDQVVDRQGSES